MHDLGVGASGGDFYGAFDEWLIGYWKQSCTAFDKEIPEDQSAKVELSYLSDNRTADLGSAEMRARIVTQIKSLVDMSFANARAKHHLEISLPPGMSYKAGDYLAVLPRNQEKQTDRVLRRFGLLPDTLIQFDFAPDGLPINRPLTCRDLLTNYVELAQPATRRQVSQLAENTRSPRQNETLLAMADGQYEDAIVAKRSSVIDLLEANEASEISSDAFVGMLPVIKPRQYSISSSPLVDPSRASLTVAVVDAPAWSGQGQYHGVASQHLATRMRGDRVSVAVQPGPEHFCLPADSKKPVIMICAGSGFAPFRGFLQERAEQIKLGNAGRPIGLFFGVDHPDCDLLYKEELDQYERDVVIQSFYAFSEKPQGDVKFVQHRVWAERDYVASMIGKGAQILVCGDGEYMEPAVRETLKKIYAEKFVDTDLDPQQWFEQLERDRQYIADVFN